MQKIYSFGKAISFFKKGVALSLLVLLWVTGYSGPVDKNTDRKTDYNFFTENSPFTSRPNSKGEGSYSTDDCTYTLSANKAATSDEGAGEVTVTASSTSCTNSWTATSREKWITLTSGQSGTGSGKVGYTYKANMETGSRRGTVYIAGEFYTFIQEGRPLIADSYEPNNTVADAAQAASFTPAFTGNVSTIPISATCHHSNDVDIYKINLRAGHTYTISGALYGGIWYFQIDNSNYALAAKISYSVNGGVTWEEWRNNFGERQLSVVTISGETLYLKIEPASQGEGTYAAKIDVKIAATAGCVYTLSETSKEITSDAGIGQPVYVATSESCAWTATSNADWITLTSGQSGTGNGSVGYSYNKAWSEISSRIGTIIIAGQTYTVTQLPLTLTPDGYEGNTGNNTPEHAWSLPEPVFNNENMSTTFIEANCHNLEDVDIYKINLRTGYSYTVSGDLYERFKPFNNNHYSLDTEISCSGNGSTWNSWEGSSLFSKIVQEGTLYLKIKARYPGVGTYAARIVIKIASMAGCDYTLSDMRKAATLDAGIGETGVTTGSSCIWTATSNADWITLTSGQSRTGSSNVGYAYKTNMATYERSATITIADQTYTITQDGRPLVSDNYEPNNTVGEISQAGTFTPAFTENASSLSIEANCHTNADVDIYKINLGSGYFYRISGDLYNLYYQIDNSNYTLLSKISYSTDGSTWNEWNIPFEREPGKIVSGGILYLKIEPYRQGPAYDGDKGNYFAKIDIKIAGAVGCNYVLPVTDEQLTWKAKTGQRAELTASSSGNLSCVWTATSNTPWITLTSHTGTGTGHVVYSYKANTSNISRTGTITIVDKTYTVTQNIRPDENEPNNIVEDATSLTATFTHDASTVDILGTNCHSTNDIDIYKIINLEAGCLFTISGALYGLYNQIDNSDYTIYPKISCSIDGFTWNEWGDTQLPDTTVQGGETLYLKIEPDYSYTSVGTYAARINIKKVAGCTYNLSARRKQATSQAGADQVTVTASSLCTSSWTSTSNVNWITITSGQSGTGSGSVGYSYTENKTGSSRTGIITVAGKTFTLSQSIVTGIETIAGIRIFPNPARNFVTIDLSSTHIKCASIKISNQLGQILYEQNNPTGKLQIPLKGLTTGLYFIFLQEEEKVMVQKLVVE